MYVNEVLEVISEDALFSADIVAWCQRTGNELTVVKEEAATSYYHVRKRR